MKETINRTIAPVLSSLTVPFILPYSRHRLSNGIEVISTSDSNQEVFKIDVVFEAGAVYQPKPLIASTAINMLNEGTSKFNAESIAEQFDYYGAYIDFNCGMNKSELSLISLNKYAQETIGMLSEMIRDSIIPEKELEIFLRNKRQQFLVNNEKTGYIARKEFTKLLFGANHPYADVVSADDYHNITAQELKKFYKEHINASNCRIVVSGNVSERILNEIERNFSNLSEAERIEPTPEYSFEPAIPGYYKIDKEDAVQASLRIGKKGLILTDADYSRFQLLNTILGGYFGSRLMSNIREEKGYTYGINSFNVSMPQCGYWGIATDINSQFTDATINEVKNEIQRLQHELIGDDELQLVKNYLHGELLRELDGVFSQSDTLKHKLNYGLDNQVYRRIIKEIVTCSAAEIRELANKYLNCNEMYYVVVG